MKKQKQEFFHRFLITVCLIDFTEAGKLCDFAEKFPCKGKHCFNPYVNETTATAMISHPTTTSLTTFESRNTVSVCPPNMSYSSNVSCSRTCRDPDNTTGSCSNFLSSNLTCVCDEGLFMNGTHCVTEQDCGCYVTNFGILKDGESYVNANCTMEYSCINNSVVIDRTYMCSDDALCEVRDDRRRCYCNDGFSGDGLTCWQRDCYDLFITGSTTDGLYTIYPAGWESTGYQVYCEMSTNGGGWTVFQKRSTSAEIFEQNWDTYKAGFGNPLGDHWLGNNILHALTHQRSNQLRVDLVYQAGTSYYAHYNHFYIGNEVDKYRLSVGSYRGTAGDSMSQENGSQFSTYDQDNDKDAVTHCAIVHRGAWWYSSQSQNRIACQHSSQICSKANLNGLVTHDHDYHGTFWSTLTHSGSCSLEETKMRIRPTS